jgi:hypothetical protein
MASEILVVPEQYLEEVILIIRNGIKNTNDVPRTVKTNLHQWCDEEEQYLKELNEE